MEKTAIDQPGVFFATCARLIGPEVKLTIEQTLPGNLSMEDWQMMREIVAAVRQAIPDANSKPPGAGIGQAFPDSSNHFAHERIVFQTHSPRNGLFKREPPSATTATILARGTQATGVITSKANSRRALTTASPPLTQIWEHLLRNSACGQTIWSDILRNGAISAGVALT